MAARPSRRTLLVGAAGTLGAAGVAGTVGALLQRRDVDEEIAPPAQKVPTPARNPAAVRDAVSRTEWLHSPARGKQVRFVTVYPAGTNPERLPVCLGLHGLRGNAQWWGDPGVRHILAEAWGAGVSPYVVVAVDGGDNYWHPYNPADDPMRMLLEDVPAWLRERRLGGREGLPTLVAGVSMGGTGALLYARERIRRGRPLLGAAALSPGLFLDWRIASRRPFRDPADWAATDPLRFFPELRPTPVGVWYGDRDLFVAATRRFVDLARPEVAVMGKGRHDGAFYASVLPDLFGFLGRHVRPRTPPRAVRPARRPPQRPVG